MRREASGEDLCLQPPSRFSDSRELSEAECDRELKPSKLSAELATLLERSDGLFIPGFKAATSHFSRYQERREQERKEFTIHV